MKALVVQFCEKKMRTQEKKFYLKKETLYIYILLQGLRG